MFKWFCAAAAGIAGLRWAIRRRLRRPRESSLRAEGALLSTSGREDPDSLVTVISGLAHELRNPLSNIKLNLQLLREDLAGLLGDRQGNPPGRRLLNRLETAVGEAGRLERTLEQFLLFAANPRLQLCPAEVGSLVEELLEFFRPQAVAHHITLRVMPAATALHCQVDAVMLKQAVLNLLINARQALDEGGEIIVRTETVPASQALRIHVIDTGPGIAQEQIDKIFHAYYSTKKGGTGLGLAISRKIIEAHGGRLTVRSEVGKGSDFSIELPSSEDK